MWWLCCIGFSLQWKLDKWKRTKEMRHKSLCCRSVRLSRSGLKSTMRRQNDICLPRQWMTSVIQVMILMMAGLIMSGRILQMMGWKFLMHHSPFLSLYHLFWLRWFMTPKRRSFSCLWRSGMSDVPSVAWAIEFWLYTSSAKTNYFQYNMELHQLSD